MCSNLTKSIMLEFVFSEAFVFTEAQTGSPQDSRRTKEAREGPALRDEELSYAT